MKRESGKISMIAIICTCLILAIVVSVSVYFINTKNNSKNTTETASHTEKNETKKEEKKKNNDKKDNKKKSDNEGIDLWNGTYTNENGIEISIYRNSEDLLTVDFNRYDETETLITKGFDVEYDSKSPNTIEYEESAFDEYNVKITKNGDKLEVISTSNNDEDILKNASGTYDKKEFESLGWDGTYVNDEYTVILAQYDEKKIYATFKTDFSLASEIIEEFDNEKISYHEDLFDEKTDIEITKTDTGLSIESSSSEENNILNKITDMEFEKNN